MVKSIFFFFRKGLNRKLSLILSLSLFLSLFPQNLAFTENKAANPPEISAKSAIVIDAESGAILFEKQARTRLPIASLTKVMTALVAVEQVKNWDTTIIATKQSCEVGESEIYLEPGERITLKNLLYATLLKSANDAATLLSESVAGNVPLFVAMMNRKAKELGLKDTHFQNPHGLTAKNHYSSALDCAIMARESLKNDLLREIFQTKKVRIPRENKKGISEIINHNKLVLRYPFVKGIKTGYTRAAGNCLISYAEYGNRKVIAVVLNAPSSLRCYEDSLRLLEYGRSQLKEIKPVKKGQVLETITRGTFFKHKYSAFATSDVIVVAPKSFNDFRYKLIKFPQKASNKEGIVGVLMVYKKDKVSGATFVKLKEANNRANEDDENRLNSGSWLDFIRRIL